MSDRWTRPINIRRGVLCGGSKIDLACYQLKTRVIVLKKFVFSFGKIFQFECPHPILVLLKLRISLC